MEDEQSTLSQRIRAFNEDGQLYLLVGAITAFISWVILPIAGLIAVYCGYRLYRDENRSLAGGVVGVIGFLGVVIWIAYLSTL